VTPTNIYLCIILDSLSVKLILADSSTPSALGLFRSLEHNIDNKNVVENIQNHVENPLLFTVYVFTLNNKHFQTWKLFRLNIKQMIRFYYKILRYDIFHLGWLWKYLGGLSPPSCNLWVCLFFFGRSRAIRPVLGIKKYKPYSSSNRRPDQQPRLDKTVESDDVMPNKTIGIFAVLINDYAGVSLPRFFRVQTNCVQC